MELGICVPSSCSAAEIYAEKELITTLLKLVPGVRKYIKSSQLNHIDCDISSPRKMDAGAIGCILIICIFITLVIIGTIIELLEDYSLNNYQNITNEEPVDDGRSSPEDQIGSSSLSETASEAGIVESELRVIKTHRIEIIDTIKRSLICFSIRKNGSKLFNTEKKTDLQLDCIHGIRFFSMAWIICAHSYLWPLKMYSNILDAFEGMDTLSFYTILNGGLAVDTFFLLSGLLLSYLFLIDWNQHSRRNWFNFYFHRFWRLTPVYMMILWFNASVLPYLGYGPFWNHGSPSSSDGKIEYQTDVCARNWWTNLFYINNFWSIDENCLPWSWYLANDMQFHLISPLFLIPLATLPKVGVAITLLIAFISWIVTWIINYHHKFTQMFHGISVIANHGNDTAHVLTELQDYYNSIYEKPYCRIGPFLIGLLVGYLIFKSLQEQIAINKRWSIIGWIISFILCLTSLYSAYHAKMTPIEASFYNALFRSSWAFGVSWIIFTCVTKKSTFINAILSYPLWVPLSRATYSAYLIHPIIITIFYQNFNDTIAFSHAMILAYFTAFLIWVYAVSLIISLIFESPLIELEKLIVKKPKREMIISKNSAIESNNAVINVMS